MLDYIPPDILDGLIKAFKYIYWATPIWLPILFLTILFNAWIYYRRSAYFGSLGSVLLEIKLPKEIFKSPAAMEIVLQTLSQGGGETTWIDRVWLGKKRDWFSLEIVSTGGKVSFYIWTRPKYKNVIESQIYSQYPGVEVYEVEDYTTPFFYQPGQNDIWGCGFQLTAPDPYPIKTYIDYGLEKDPKEEFKIDPMTATIEFLGSITSGQNIWLQILVRSHKKRRILDLFDEKEDAWKDEAKSQIKTIIEGLKIEGSTFGRIPTKGEAEKIAALERSVTKLPFDCGIRAIYFAEKDKFNSANIGGITGSFKQYGSLDLNGFKPSGWMTIFDYPWQEWFGAKEKLKPILLDEYKLRRFFHSPYLGKNFYHPVFVLNVEELATIFHFVGSVASTPTFERVASKKSEAPANLPI